MFGITRNGRTGRSCPRPAEGQAPPGVRPALTGLGGDPVTPEEVYCGDVAVGIPKWQGWARDAKRKLDELMADDAESHGRKAS